MKHVANLVVAVVCFAAFALHAQEPGNPQRDLVGEHVLPPELIMQYQKAIGLNEAQKNAVIAEVKRAQTRMVDLQWDMQRAMERLVELLGQDKPDEQAAIAQLDSVLGVERDIKRAHIALAVRLKNLLTPEQQRALRELRSSKSAAADAPVRR